MAAARQEMDTKRLSGHLKMTDLLGFLVHIRR
jgi:hypothetical protein